ncbi:unnamed protein product [Blepharisma stoltei]|uniref:Protein pelota homolog n=1 Tax=Blepharisma stoltei TaxID=1481888 RepID=A0AAU9JBH9_9CILI|nr:unnamed protein product [Blepharisma stoltei]
MKILNQNLVKGGQGSITVKMDVPDDMWHIYNIINNGDAIKATTLRKIKEESKTGSVVTTKKKISLLLRIRNVDYDPEGPTLRISGQCISENQYLQLGQHHTFDLQLHIPFTLIKRQWDALHIDRIKEASNPATHCEVAALVMEEGLAHLCLITNTATIIKSKIETQIPRKRKGASGHDKALEKFFEKCNQGIAQHINFDVVRCILIASPGFVKDQFVNYLEQEKPQWYSPNKIMLTHASSGEKQALDESLSDPKVKEMLSNTEFSQDLQYLEEFFRVLSVDPNSAVYSLADVQLAARMQAINVLLVSDAILRNFKQLSVRQSIAEISEDVKAHGGSVRVISSLHVAGEKLKQLSGIAALLRFPIYGIGSEEEESQDEEEKVPEEEEEMKIDLEELGLDEEEDEDFL